VYEFYVSNFEDITDITKLGTPEVIDTITGGDWFEYVPNKNSSNAVENVQSSLENGTVGYEQVITMIFGKMEADKRNQIALMGAGTLMIIAKDKNGRFWLYGENDGMVLSGGNTGTGTALTDLNGYNLTFTAMEGELAYEVAETAFTPTP